MHKYVWGFLGVAACSLHTRAEGVDGTMAPTEAAVHHTSQRASEKQDFTSYRHHRIPRCSDSRFESGVEGERKTCDKVPKKTLLPKREQVSKQESNPGMQSPLPSISSSVTETKTPTLCMKLVEYLFFRNLPKQKIKKPLAFFSKETWFNKTREIHPVLVEWAEKVRKAYAEIRKRGRHKLRQDLGKNTGYTVIEV